MVSLTWRSDVSEGPASALGLYRDKNGRITWVPFVWRGLHAGDAEDAKSLHVFLSGYDRRPGFRYGLAPASPIGVVLVVIDRLAGLRVRLEFPHLPMAIVTADGELVQKLDPVPPVGTVVDAGEYTSSVGYPEKALARLSSDTVFNTLQGTTERSVFELVNQYPGSPMADLAQGVGHPQSRIRAIVNAFDSAELVEILDARPYLAKPGRNKAAHRDRMHANVIHRRFGIYTDPSSTYRLQQRNHDADAGRMVAHCSTADISHGAGWRLEIISSNGTQLRPDLYVLIPRGDGYGVWHAFELERSAFSSSAIALKSNPSRVARDEGEPWPYLWATGKSGRGTRAENHDREAARRFMEIGGDLDQLVIPAAQVQRDGLSLTEPAWLYRGSTVPITHLTTGVQRSALIERMELRVW